jgi:hypothetical protein
VETGGEQAVVVSNFVGTFCLPFICATAAVTLAALVEKVVAAKVATGCLLPTRSFGQWVALICLSVLTVGIIWIVAKAIVSRDMKKDGSDIKLFFNAANGKLELAAQPELPNESEDDLLKIFIQDTTVEEFVDVVRLRMCDSHIFNESGNPTAFGFPKLLFPDVEGEQAANEYFAKILGEFFDYYRGAFSWNKSRGDYPEKWCALAAAVRRRIEAAVAIEMLKEAEKEGAKLFTAKFFPGKDAEPGQLAPIELGRFTDGKIYDDIIPDIGPAIKSILDDNGFGDLYGKLCDKIRAYDKASMTNVMLGIAFALSCGKKNSEHYYTDKDMSSSWSIAIWAVFLNDGKTQHAQKLACVRDQIADLIAEYCSRKCFAIGDSEITNGGGVTVKVADSLAEMACGDGEVRASIAKVVAMEKALKELEDRRPRAADVSVADVHDVSGELTNFERVFLVPFALQQHRTTEVDACKTAHVVDLSFGDWTARILLSILTAGIIWLCAYFMAKKQAARRSGVFLKIFRKNSSIVATEPEAPRESEPSNMCAEEAIGKIATYLFVPLDGSGASVAGKGGILDCMNSRFAGCYSGKYAFLGPDKKFHSFSMQSLQVKSCDGRTGEDIFNTFVAAFGVGSKFKLSEGVDLFGKDRETWNWFIETVMARYVAGRVFASTGRMTADVMVLITDGGDGKEFVECVDSCATSVVAELEKMEVPSGIDQHHWQEWKNGGFLKDAVKKTISDSFQVYGNSDFEKLKMCVVAKYFGFELLRRPLSKFEVARQLCKAMVDDAKSNGYDLDESVAACVAEKIDGIARQIFNEQISAISGYYKPSQLRKTLDMRALNPGTTNTFAALRSSAGVLALLNSMYYGKVPKHILRQIEASP